MFQWLAALLELQRCRVVGDALRNDVKENEDEKETEECPSSAAVEIQKAPSTAIQRAARAVSESPVSEAAATSGDSTTTRKRRSSTNDVSSDYKLPKTEPIVPPLSTTDKLIELEAKLTRTLIRSSATAPSTYRILIIFYRLQTIAFTASAEEDELIRALALQRLQQLRPPPRPSRLPQLRLDDSKSFG